MKPKNLNVIFLFLIISVSIKAQDKDKKENNVGLEKLEFSHPLFTESISPDTKARFIYLYARNVSQFSSQLYDIELEYAPAPVFSIHLDLPYSVVNNSRKESIGNLDNIAIDFKFANFAFADHNILLGYGIGIDLPTGNQYRSIGSNHVWNINPFLNGGLINGKWEWTTFMTFEIPTNQYRNESLPTGFDIHFTSLYHINRKLEGLIEAGYSTQFSGSIKENNYDITEGIKFKPNPDKPWILALGIREPVFRNSEIKIQGMLSLFYHFKD